MVDQYTLFADGKITHLPNWPGSRNLPVGAWIYHHKPPPSSLHTNWLHIVMTLTNLKTWKYHPDEDVPKEHRMYILLTL